MILPDYFAFYGIPQSFHPDTEVVRKQYYAHSRNFHPDRVQQSDEKALAESLSMSAMNNEAYKILNDPDRLMGYILRLHGVVEEEEAYKLPPAFLMEMMELNEAIGNADMDPSLKSAAVQEYENAMNSWKHAVAPRMLAFDQGDRSPELLAALKDFYYRKKYLLRIRERILA